MNNPGDTRTICYKFRFDANNAQDFVIHLNGETLDIIEEPKDTYPEWAKLDHQKCTNCPLNSEEHEFCPIAKKLVGTVDFFCKPLEFSEVDLRVETPERVISKKTDLKSAAVSLIGIYMATGGCPIMDKLRPMVRHHLPLATTPETTYRSVANYLVGQYLASQRGKEPDWELKDLGGIYDAIKIVNSCFRERLLKISREDCALSAILTLDAHAYYINLSLIGDTFYTVESLFDNDAQAKNILFDTELPDDASTYCYEFTFNNDFTKKLTYSVNPESHRLIHPENASLPSWTKLGCQKCPNCPLDEIQHPHCPAAAAISEAIESLSETLPIEKADVSVKTTERDFSKYSTVTEGLSSVMDLVLVLSGCPIFGQLKPLARNHLPFETTCEQIYRSLGMYLLYQKFSEKHKAEPDWGLKNFAAFHNEIATASDAFRSRLKEIAIEEEGLNVLTNLNFFSKYTNFEISGGPVEELQKLFEKSYP